MLKRLAATTAAAAVGASLILAPPAQAYFSDNAKECWGGHPKRNDCARVSIEGHAQADGTGIVLTDVHAWANGDLEEDAPYGVTRPRVEIEDGFNRTHSLWTSSTLGRDNSFRTRGVRVNTRCATVLFSGHLRRDWDTDKDFDIWARVCK